MLAHQAAEQGDGPKAARLLWLTILGGAMFLIVKSFEWTHEIREGFTIPSGGFWSYYYTAAGLHAFHVIAGMCVMLWVAATAREEPGPAPRRERRASTGTSSTSSGSSCSRCCTSPSEAGERA